MARSLIKRIFSCQKIYDKYTPTMQHILHFILHAPLDTPRFPQIIHCIVKSRNERDGHAWSTLIDWPLRSSRKLTWSFFFKNRSHPFLLYSSFSLSFFLPFVSSKVNLSIPVHTMLHPAIAAAILVGGVFIAWGGYEIITRILEEREESRQYEEYVRQHNEKWRGEHDSDDEYEAPTAWYTGRRQDMTELRHRRGAASPHSSHSSTTAAAVPNSLREVWMYTIYQSDDKTI